MNVPTSNRNAINPFWNLGLEYLLSGAQPTHRTKAKRVVQIFLSGAASSVDLYDYKPMLEQRKGQPFDPGGKLELFQSQPGVVMPSAWGFQRAGQSGRYISKILPKLATCVDDMAFVYSMTSKSNVHGPATFLQTTGFVQPGFPSMGAWIAHGLGSLTDNLPVFVALPDSRGVPPNGPANWGAGFLPAATQGVVIRPGSNVAIRDLTPPPGKNSASDEVARRRFLSDLNAIDARKYGTDDALMARIKSHQLAAKLQLSAPEAMDVSRESAATKQLYGIDNHHTHDLGTRCLVARRLLERGVRFVQIWSGADNGFPRRNWDSHEDLKKDHADMATELDTPVAGLLRDLKIRGLLDDTIVLCTSEFGRMPCSQGGKGRDHNPEAFTTWLAGGGIKGGAEVGLTDEWGYRVAQNPVTGYDVHATVLALLGVDHTSLTFRHNGVNRRLTDVHGHVLKQLIKQG
jgi:uncharacterized protein (DUF1501 family)